MTSQLADMDIEVGSIAWEGDYIVVQTAPGAGIDTRIEIGPRDVLRILGRILRRPAILGYVFALPFLYRRTRGRKPVDPADPWSQS